MKEILNIKTLLLLFVTLITFTNIGYASFPVLGENIISIDNIIPDTNKSVKKETTEEYHLRMEKQGFDIESCVCESCRDGKIFLNNNKTDKFDAKSVYIFAGILFGILLIWFLIVMFREINCINHNSLCSSTFSVIFGVPAELFWMAVLGWTSILVAIKAWLMQKKYKKRLSEKN